VIRNSFKILKSFCEKEQFKGWDPYDGLNSRIFNALPFNKSALCRLIMIQTFKRNPINLRRLFLIPKEFNAKGLGLFLSAYCDLYNLPENEQIKIGISKVEVKNKIVLLANKLLEMKSKNYSGACWGYNFDWQARRLFLFPKNTPTVVATSFVASALMNAYEVTRNIQYLDVALSSANFIINDLGRTQKKEGFLFSYSPLEGNNTVYNASLLGSKLLSLCYKYTNNKEYISLARESVLACCNEQKPDGSWLYGELSVQNWVDSFHTGYNLDAIKVYQECSDDMSFNENIELGFKYYVKNFFEKDGCPKYYNNRKYPIDIHCPAQLIMSLDSLNKFDENKQLASRVIEWSVNNMQDKEGFFYYQKRKGLSSKIPYMRWSQAFMFKAMSTYLKNTKGND
jgi:hypothetical protein